MELQAPIELALRQQDCRKRPGTPADYVMQASAAITRKSGEARADECAPRFINFKLGDSVDSLSLSMASSASTRTSTVTRSSSPSYYNGPLSPASISSISSIHSPPSIAGMRFCHSRDSSFDTDATGLSFYSGDRPDPSLEDDDEDLRAYRQSEPCMFPDSTSADTSVAGFDDCPPRMEDIISDATTYNERGTVTDDDARSVIRCEEISSRTASDGQHDNTLATSDTDTNLDASAHRVANKILDEEFEVLLGRSEPPPDIVEAVRACLEEISLSLEGAQHLGVFATHTAAPHPDQSASPSSSNPTTGNWSSNSRSNGQRKRSSQNLGGGGGGGDRDLQDEDSSGEDDGADQLNSTQQRKKVKCEPEEYPCPFRKRNPVRFNCRDFEYCAKAPFKSMTDLKKHIIKYHRRQQEQQQCAFTCVRCHFGFVKFEDWHEHMTRDPENMCKTTNPPTSEDGISRSLDTRLRGRSEHFTWVTLWKSLFELDTEVPEPVFEPIVELHEVRAEYESGLPDFQLRLASTVATLLANRGPNSQHVLCSSLDNLFKDFTATVFGKALSAAATQSRPTRPRTERTVSETPSQAVHTSSIASTATEPILRPILPSTAGGSSSNRSSSVSSSAWLSPATTRQSHQSFSSDSSASRGSRPVLALPVHHRHVQVVQQEVQLKEDASFHPNSQRDSAIDVEGMESVLFPLTGQFNGVEFEDLVDYSLCDANLNLGDANAYFDVCPVENAVADDGSGNIVRA